MKKPPLNRAVRMESAIVPAAPAGALQVAAPPQIDMDALIADWLGGKSRDTMKSYKDSLDSFRRFCKCEREAQAVEGLIALPHGHANMVALKYKNWLKEQGNTPGSVNTRLSALRSIVAIAHLVGRVPWTLAVKNEKNQVYKDTRGPGAEGFDKLLETAAAQKDSKKAVRDLAILWLLYGQVLRRAGVSSLDYEHIDWERSRLFVMLKGHRERTWFTVNQNVIAALKAWIKVRGKRAGPLFPNMDHAHKGSGGGSRIGGGGIWSIVSSIGERSGLKTWPHALRHAGITTALDATGGDLRAVQRFSGHANVTMLQVYDDNRADLGGEVAKKVGARHTKKELPE